MFGNQVAVIHFDEQFLDIHLVSQIYIGKHVLQTLFGISLHLLPIIEYPVEQLPRYLLDLFQHDHHLLEG